MSRTRPPGTLSDLEPFRPPGAPERRVRAYVPAGLTGPAPLLVLLDGQNVFSDHGSFAGGWYAHEAVDRLVRPPIVVAVDNGGAHRVHELGPGVREFVAAVALDLVPRLERRFPLAGPESRALGGASLGGLAALVAWLDHPEVFGAAMAMSPSLWFGRGALLTEIERAASLPESRLYVDAGARERGRMFADAARLADLLSERVEADRLLWRPDQRGTHHERHWRRRLPKALRFLFKSARGAARATARSDRAPASPRSRAAGR